MRIRVSFGCHLCNQNSDKCNAFTHINSEIPPGDDGMVVIAIPLGDDQFDLAVDKAIVERVKSCFIDLSNLRLSSSDPFFAAEYGRSYPETAFDALERMLYLYDKAASSMYMLNDSRCINWFVKEKNRLQTLLEYYRKQIECPKTDL